jgi:hypothetical protein
MKLLNVVALIQDLPELNLYRGNVGTIVEEYEPNVFEVEFSDTNGQAYAIETLNASQLMTIQATGEDDWSDLIGCVEIEENLSTTYKQVLAEGWAKKYASP